MNSDNVFQMKCTVLSCYMFLACNGGNPIVIVTFSCPFGHVVYSKVKVI